MNGRNIKTYNYQIVVDLEPGDEHDKLLNLAICDIFIRTTWFYSNRKIIYEISELTKEEVTIIKLSLNPNAIFILLPSPHQYKSIFSKF